MWFCRSSPRSLPASILDASRQTASLANAEEAIAPSSSRRRSERAMTSRAGDILSEKSTFRNLHIVPCGRARFSTKSHKLHFRDFLDVVCLSLCLRGCRSRIIRQFFGSYRRRLSEARRLAAISRLMSRKIVGDYLPLRSLLAARRTQDMDQGTCVKGSKFGSHDKHLAGGPAAAPRGPVDLGRRVGQLVNSVGVPASPCWELPPRQRRLQFGAQHELQHPPHRCHGWG